MPKPDERISALSSLRNLLVQSASFLPMQKLSSIIFIVIGKARFTTKPKYGDLLISPSYLYHSTPPLVVKRTAS